MRTYIFIPYLLTPHDKMNIASVILTIISLSSANVVYRDEVCRALLGDELIEEIAAYESVKDEIFKYVLEGEFKSKSYDE